MFLHHHSICKMFLHAVLFSIFLLTSPPFHLKGEKKMLRTNQTYISLEKKMTTNLLDLESHRQLGAWVYKPMLNRPLWDVSLDYFLLLLDPCYFSQPRDLQDKFNLSRADSISPHSGNRTSKAVVCVWVHAHAKVAFLRHLSRLFASVISWSGLFSKTKGSTGQVPCQISYFVFLL